MWPMIATGPRSRDARRAAEVAHPIGQRVVEQSALRHVFQQRGERLIGTRRERIFQQRKVIAVRVPRIVGETRATSVGPVLIFVAPNTR